MPDYHPLDTRHKANKTGSTQKAGKPWRNVAEPPPPPGAKPGQIRDSDLTEWRAREKTGNAAEKAALQETPLIANFFGPATLYYKIRAALIGERARGHSPGKIALQIVGAFVLYFAIVYLHGLSGLDGMLSGSTMRTID